MRRPKIHGFSPLYLLLITIFLALWGSPGFAGASPCPQANLFKDEFFSLTPSLQEFYRAGGCARISYESINNFISAPFVVVTRLSTTDLPPTNPFSILNPGNQDLRPIIERVHLDHRAYIVVAPYMSATGAVIDLNEHPKMASKLLKVAPERSRFLLLSPQISGPVMAHELQHLVDIETGASSRINDEFVRTYRIFGNQIKDSRIRNRFFNLLQDFRDLIMELSGMNGEYKFKLEGQLTTQTSLAAYLGLKAPHSEDQFWDREGHHDMINFGFINWDLPDLAKFTRAETGSEEHLAGEAICKFVGYALKTLDLEPEKRDFFPPCP